MTPTDTQAATRVTRLSRVVLEDDGAASLPPLIEADRAQAVADLAATNRFALLSPRRAGDADGPYALHLAIRDGRLVFDVRNDDDAPLAAIGLALGPFRSLIKDYQMLVDSHIMRCRRAAWRGFRRSTWDAVACTTKAPS